MAFLFLMYPPLMVGLFVVNAIVRRFEVFIATAVTALCGSSNDFSQN